jgi:hypothetical protein
MDSRTLLDLSNTLQSPFWNFFKSKVVTQVAEMRKDASVMTVASQADSDEREYLLKGSRALESILETFPEELKQELEAAKKLEAKSKST